MRIRCNLCDGIIEAPMKCEFAVAQAYVKSSGRLGYKYLNLCPACYERIERAIKGVDSEGEKDNSLDGKEPLIENPNFIYEKGEIKCTLS